MRPKIPALTLLSLTSVVPAVTALSASDVLIVVPGLYVAPDLVVMNANRRAHYVGLAVSARRMSLTAATTCDGVVVAM